MRTTAEVAHYLDTSALVKLVVAEAETTAMREWLAGEERDPVSSDLARAELLRAVRRVAPDRALQARAVLDSITLLQISPSTFDHAGRLEPHGLRTLDAVHLAAALSLGDDLDAIVTYDDRQARAANANGVPATGPV
jgi:predicted nucleic acid-binding protein